MLRSRKFWKLRVGYVTSDSATLMATLQYPTLLPVSDSRYPRVNKLAAVKCYDINETYCKLRQI